jgi:hypothetical protein
MGPNFGLVKALSKAGRLRYHQPPPTRFDALSGEILATRATLWRHAVAVFGADTAPTGVTVRSGLRALSER